jgi:hypothetical protein
MERMSNQNLEQLTRNYYGYVADLEGSGVETLDLLAVRDKIEAILDQSAPTQEIPLALYQQIHELDRLLWAERETFLNVIGLKELHHARQLTQTPRSHWWWYLDSLTSGVALRQETRRRPAPVSVPA